MYDFSDTELNVRVDSTFIALAAFIALVVNSYYLGVTISGIGAAEDVDYAGCSRSLVAGILFCNNLIFAYCIFAARELHRQDQARFIFDGGAVEATANINRKR